MEKYGAKIIRIVGFSSQVLNHSQKLLQLLWLLTKIEVTPDFTQTDAICHSWGQAS
jgi:hypothetical protein